jgi:hypothetical protein
VIGAAALACGVLPRNPILDSCDRIGQRSRECPGANHKRDLKSHDPDPTEQGTGGRIGGIYRFTANLSDNHVSLDSCDAGSTQEEWLDRTVRVAANLCRPDADSSLKPGSQESSPRPNQSFGDCSVVEAPVTKRVDPRRVLLGNHLSLADLDSCDLGLSAHGEKPWSYWRP